MKASACYKFCVLSRYKFSFFILLIQISPLFAFCGQTSVYAGQVGLVRRAKELLCGD